MNYYIINKKIRAFEQEFDSKLYDYPKLTAEQTAFYEANNCTLDEVLAMELNVPYVPSLEEIKASKINYFAQLSMECREKLVPDYKLFNASLGIYDEATTTVIKNKVIAFRNEFYRLESLVNASKTKEEVESIKDYFSTI